MKEKKVLIISTGGTIGGEIASNVKECQPEDQARRFPEILKDIIDYISCAFSINIIINHFELCELDSSNIDSKIWTELSNKIKTEYDNFDSFIITHGTNTLGYTSSALSFALANLRKPVILTGSQVPSGLPGSDAIINLENALRIAVYDSLDFNDD